MSACERIRIDGVPISEDLFAENLRIVYEEVCVKAKTCGLIMPGYFPFMTFLAFYTFAQEDLDFIILEVGVGGKYDATSIYPDYYDTSETGKLINEYCCLCR